MLNLRFMEQSDLESPKKLMIRRSHLMTGI